MSEESDLARQNARMRHAILTAISKEDMNECRDDLKRAIDDDQIPEEELKYYFYDTYIGPPKGINE